MRLSFTPEKRTTLRMGVIWIAFAALMTGLIVYFPPVWAFISQVLSLFTPIFVGISVAFVMYPLQKRLDGLLLRIPLFKKKPMIPRVISSLLSILLLLVLIALFFSIVAPQVVQSMSSIGQYAANFVEAHAEEIRDFLVNFNILDADSKELIADWKSLVTQLLNVTPSLVGRVVSVSGSIVSVAANFLIGLVTAVYILLDKERLFALVKKIGYACLRREKMDELIYWTRQGGSLFSGFISGKLLDSALIGALCYVGMRIFGWEYPVLIAVIIGVSNIIPFFGPFIGWTPSALILLMINPSHALWFTVFLVILQQLDGNVIGPFILGDRVGLSPLSITVAIMVGGGLFGLLGMLICVPCYALLYGIIRTSVARKLRDKGLSDKTEDYRDAPEDMKPYSEEKEEQTEKKKK